MIRDALGHATEHGEAEALMSRRPKTSLISAAAAAAAPRPRPANARPTRRDRSLHTARRDDWCHAVVPCYWALVPMDGWSKV